MGNIILFSKILYPDFVHKINYINIKNYPVEHSKVQNIFACD